MWMNHLHNDLCRSPTPPDLPCTEALLCCPIGNLCFSGTLVSACTHLVPLDWHTATASQLCALEADVVVASDVVYDLIDNLVWTIKGVLAGVQTRIE